MAKLHAVFALLGLAAGSHFRYGTISWVPFGGNAVEFKFLTAWRRSYWPGSGLCGDDFVAAGETFEVASGGKGNKWYFGDSDGPDLKVKVTRPLSCVNDMDYILDNALGATILNHQYPSPTNSGTPWLAGYRGCCRLDANQFGDPQGDEEDGLNNNGGRSWDVKTKVDLSGGPLKVMKDRSPTAVGGKPILRLRWDTVEKFDIVVIDPDDDKLTWRLGNPSELGDAENKQPGWGTNKLRAEPPYNGAPMTDANKLGIFNKIVINKRGEEVRFGEAYWDTNGMNTGYWQSTIMISSGNADIPYDFLLLVKNPKGNEPPKWDEGPNALTPAPEDSLEVVCPTGKLSYTMKCIDSGPTDKINIALINDPPSGMKHMPLQSLGPGGFQNPVQQVINWTPLCFQKGKHVMCYQATDDNANQQLDSRVRCIIIQVTEITNMKPEFCKTPLGTCAPTTKPEYCQTPLNGQQIPVCVGQMVKFKVEVCDENVEDTVSIQFRSGVPLGSIITNEVNGRGTYPNWPKKNQVVRTFNLDPQQSLEDGDVCFEGVDSPPQGGVASTSLSTGLRCVKLTVRYPPRFISPTPLGNSEGNYRFSAKVCELLQFSVTADDKNKDADEDVTIFVLEDPGIPNGAIVEKNVCPAPIVDEGITINVRCNPVSRQFKWTPAKGQEGKTYKVCFIARDNKDNCQKGGYYSQKADNPCIDISVHSPMPMWDDSTPADDKNFNVFVGCTHEHTIGCQDQNTAISGYAVTAYVSEDSELPSGAVLAPCRIAALNDDAEVNPARRCSRDFSWKPVRGQEGYVYDICYTCSDQGCTEVLHDGNIQRFLPPMNTTEVRCITITVVRCKYCVQRGDTLHYINKYYHLDANWLRLWNANGNSVDHANTITAPVHDPDMVLFDTQVISVGPTYRVQAGDSLQNLANRFHTTVKKVMSVNPDLANVDDIAPGQELCILPCSDVPQNPEDFKYNYA